MPLSIVRADLDLFKVESQDAPRPRPGRDARDAVAAGGWDYPRILVSSTVVWSGEVRTAKVSATW